MKDGRFKNFEHVQYMIHQVHLATSLVQLLIPTYLQSRFTCYLPSNLCINNIQPTY